MGCVGASVCRSLGRRSPTTRGIYLAQELNLSAMYGGERAMANDEKMVEIRIQTDLLPAAGDEHPNTAAYAYSKGGKLLARGPLGTMARFRRSAAAARRAPTPVSGGFSKVARLGTACCGHVWTSTTACAGR